VVIVTAILAILAAFAMMSYQGYVVRTKRSAASSCLLEAAQYMERFYTINMRYDQSRTGAAPQLPQNCARELENDYTISLSASSATAYTLTAQPQGAQASKDTDCGTLSVDQV